MPLIWCRPNMQRLPARTQALIFDLDDTLIHSTRAYAWALCQMGVRADAHGLHAAKARVKQRLGDGHPASHQRLLYFKAWQEAAKPHRRLLWGPKALLAWTHAYERAVATHLAAQWRALSRGPWIRRLAEQMPIAICTNETTRMQLLKWAAIDPGGQWCRAFVTSEEMGVEKPAPRMLIEAAARLGVPVSHCCMVGDSVRNDIAPAVKLGMVAVWTTEFVPRRVQALQRRALPRCASERYRVDSVSQLRLI